LQASQRRFHSYVIAGDGTAQEALDALVEDWTEVFDEEGKY
jgi:multiple sugar transport system substrate-binding protein